MEAMTPAGRPLSTAEPLLPSEEGIEERLPALEVVADDEPRRITRGRGRDSHLRRLLALADVGALSVALGTAVLIFGSDTVNVAVLAMPLLLLTGMKLLGLYDRDAPMIHKTTLEEVPTLFGAAAITVLVLFLGGDLFVSADFSSSRAWSCSRRCSSPWSCSGRAQGGCGARACPLSAACSSATPAASQPCERRSG